ncbi:DUF2508 family protein [Orenia marismortui]|uniref:DUF2508 family protein n=1 Tax=Orenia marismortui TaxID=46469 RepID=UPI00036095B6|nr:DUF2508 family protein [Orenia marismortui]
MNLGVVRRIFNFSTSELELEDNLNYQIEEAREEWQEARKYFNSVSDPDLIDHAIYLLEAAESRYSYLVKKKKEHANS